jgi:tellurite methyltransferase
LAEQGYGVDLIDISRTALLRARDEAARRGLNGLNFYPFDLDAQTDLEGQYDLVCVFRYLNRDLFTRIRQAVKPGGRIIYETFNQRHKQRAPNFNPDYLLMAGELVGYFADWKLLTHLEETATSRLVAIKPD